MRPRTGFLGKAAQLQLANLSCGIWKAASRMARPFALLFLLAEAPARARTGRRWEGRTVSQSNLRLRA